jgi:hypothetical protein
MAAQVPEKESKRFSRDEVAKVSSVIAMYAAQNKLTSLIPLTQTA